MVNIHMDTLTDYLTARLPERDDFFHAMERYAKEHRIPIMDPVSMNFVTQLVNIHQAKHVLEIGTAIGYSALRIAKANEHVHITTIEKNDNMYTLAKKNIESYDKKKQINVLHGDAIELIPQILKKNRQIEFVFIDAAKGQYKRYFQLVADVLPARGVIVCDNVLFQGYVVRDEMIERKRLQKLVQKIQSFNDWLVTNDTFHTSIVPIGDGLTISVKKEK